MLSCIVITATLKIRCAYPITAPSAKRKSSLLFLTLLTSLAYQLQTSGFTAFTLRYPLFYHNFGAIPGSKPCYLWYVLEWPNPILTQIPIRHNLAGIISLLIISQSPVKLINKVRTYFKLSMLSFIKSLKKSPNRPQIPKLYLNSYCLTVYIIFCYNVTKYFTGSFSHGIVGHW